MGLRKGDPVHHQAALATRWLPPFVVVSLCVGVGLLGEAGRTGLRFERAPIASGEFWRLLTGHLAHLGTGHLLLNGIALLIVWHLVGDRLGRREWLAATAAIIASIDIGLWFLQPRLEWYVGLSGVLHGLLVAGLAAGWQTHRTESLLLGTALAAKLAYEAMAGPLPGSAQAAGGAVIVSAHWYGTVGGLLTAIAILARRRAVGHA